MTYLKLSFLTASFLALNISSSFAEVIKISIPEMECANCSNAIENRLKQEKDITKISIDLKQRAVSVETAESVKISDERIRELVKDSGFEAKEIVRVN